MLSNPTCDLGQKDINNLNAFWIAAFHGQAAILDLLFKTQIELLC